MRRSWPPRREILIAAAPERVWPLVAEPGFWATGDEGVRGTSVTEGQVWAARHSEAGEFPMRVEKVGRHGDGEPFAATISHSGVRLWDVSPSALQVAPDLHSGQILNIGLVSDHDDGSALVTLGSEGKIRLWDAMTGDLLSTRSCPTDSAARLLVRIDDGGPRAVWAGDSGVIDTAMTGLPSQHALPVGSVSSICPGRP